MLAHVLAAALLIRNVTVIDPASANVRRGIDVLVDGATIAKIAPHIAATPDAKVIDGSGKFLVPGFRPRWDRPTIEQSLHLMLRFGITTIRDPIFGRVYWLEHLDRSAVDEMVRELVKHHVVVDPTLVAMATKFDPKWTENPDLKLARVPLTRPSATLSPLRGARANAAWLGLRSTPDEALHP